MHKLITSIKAVAHVAIFFFCVQNVLGENKTLDFSLGVSGGIKSGKVEELVFVDDAIISKLLWHESIAPFMQLDAQVKFHNFFVNAAIESVIPVKCGTMEDFDWEQPESYINNYSEHANNIDKDYTLQLKLGYNFDISKNFALALDAGIRLQNRKWSAQNGYYQSGDPWTGDEEKKYFSGIVISYEQSVLIPDISLGVLFNFSPTMGLGLNTSFLYLVYSTALDSHFDPSKNKQYLDIMSNGFGFNSGAYFLYSPKASKLCTLKASLSYEYYSIRGINFQNAIGLNAGSFSKTNAVSGTDSSLLKVGVGVIIKLVKSS
jgi:outer membrane protease